ncbi:Lipase (class 3) [Gracilaria domingensis]|nr:Lipase (class 3) [Gracilaria domingensis]
METLSNSLPSYFRYGPAPTSPFFAAEPDDPASSVPSVDVRSAKTRLEVLKGWEVNFSVLCLFFASTLALVYIFVKLRVTAAEWHQFHVIPPLNSVESVARLLLQVASVALPLFFLTSLYVAPTVTDEQIWTCIVLSVALLVSNPLTHVTSLISRATTSYIPNLDLKRSERLYFPLDIFSEDPTARLIIGDSMYTAAIYLYLILSAHSYRVFDVKSLHTLSFYAPKVALALFFFAVKLVAGFKAGVSLGLVPYSRLLTWFILYKGDRHSPRVTIPVLMTTVLDTAFAFWLVSEVARTAEFLATVPYVENRAKQLGFRCFVFQTLAFCCNMIGLSLLVTYMLPTTYIYDAYDNPAANFLQLEPPVARLGLAFVYFTWTLVVAYVNLPPKPIIPFARRMTFRILFLLRNSRVAAWLGLADIVTAEEPQDVDETVDNQVEICAEKGTIPLRYRHREMFDHILLSPEAAQPLSPLVLNPHPMSCPPCCDLRKYRSLDEDFEDKAEAKADPPKRSWSSSTTPPMDIIRTTSRRPRPSCASRPVSPDIYASSPLRLRLRKNLFVMETQVLLANATYLSYIPGNPNEERKRNEPNVSLQHISSVSTGLEELARQADGGSYARRIHDKPQPSYDDGTKFLVDPYEMAERYGYRIHKHFCDEQLNTHAIILVNSTRVVVAFSGTRDVTNWSLNANIKRVVLDDKLGKFEYELSEHVADEESESAADELNGSGFDYRALDFNFDIHDLSQEREPLRKTKSEEVLFFDEEVIPSSHRPEKSEDIRSKNYGAIPGASDSNSRRPVPSESSSPSLRGSRTQRGVSMVASTLARELLTFGQAKVHEGFINAYMSLRKQIMGSLIELYKGIQDTRAETTRNEVENSSGTSRAPYGIGKSLPLFFCGHSLGGALATFASYEAARYYKRIGLNRRQDVSCTTFGCPRLGNEAFKARYEGLVETHWRFEIASDPIPKLPGWMLNYVPVGVQVLMDQSGMLLIDPSFIEVQWWGQLSNWYMGYRLHIRASYCMALRTYCKLYKNGADDLAAKFWPFPLRVQTKGLFRQVNQ